MVSPMTAVVGEIPARCDDPYCGSLTGYKHHMDRKKLDPTEVTCAACRKSRAIASANYKKQRLLNGAKMIDRQGPNRIHPEFVGGTILVDASGTRRRLMALGMMGYTWSALSTKLGDGYKCPSHVYGALIKRNKWVYPETADKIRAIYDELSMVPPDDVYANRTIILARKRGWLPPLNWDDDEIDNPTGIPSGLTSDQLKAWYFNCATELERVSWVMQHGFSRLYRSDRLMGPGRPKADFYK